jgi:hypothetical protein
LLCRIFAQRRSSGSTAPEQTIEQPAGTQILQSRFAAADGKRYLVRVVVAAAKDPAVVDTVYRTSKIEKYWKQENV